MKIIRDSEGTRVEQTLPNGNVIVTRGESEFIVVGGDGHVARSGAYACADEAFTNLRPTGAERLYVKVKGQP